MAKGPIAPKDPVKKRDFFYIMLEKQVCAQPAPDGKGVCFLYQSDGRLLSSAKFVGNITDDEILKNLFNVEGLRRLVYGVGVSLMSKDNAPVDFVFQMYGRKDPYNSGTSIRQTITPDGAEYLVPFNEVEWSDDDNVPGQIRFEFDKAGVEASVSVRFYLNDGFKAPEFEGIEKVDTNSPQYRKLIEQSLVSAGNNARLKKVFAKLENKEPVTIAFIGGSITQGAGAAPINKESYAYKTWDGLRKKYGDLVHLVKAGVGGTPSELGMIRYERDVLQNGAVSPDIVVIEFAVNDAGDETEGECYEGLVRMALNGPGKPAVLLLFAVFVDDYNLENRLIPIGKHYDLPMVSIKSAVTKQFYLSKAEGRVIAKNSFFYDCYHPTNLGHTVMADCILNLIEKSVAEPEKNEPDYLSYSAFKSADFEKIELIDRVQNRFDTVIDAGGFDNIDNELQCCEMNFDAFGTPQFPNNWMYKGSGEPVFAMDIDCRLLLIVSKDSASPEAAKADVYVDGKLVRTIDPRQIGWTHCNPQIILRENETAAHKVEVRIHEGDENKSFTILGFAAVK